MNHSNKLIAQMSRHDRQQLIAHGVRVRLRPGAVLFDRGEDAGFIHFPTRGAVILAMPSQEVEGLGLGIILVGREGMLGMHHMLGDGLPSLRAVVQASGTALRVNASAFNFLLSSSLTLRATMLTYVGGTLNQISAVAACTRFHAIGQRLAGWLLMFRDRAANNSFRITQDCLAQILGVRRVGISAAARELQRQHLIEYHRGSVTILNAEGLRGLAGHSYLNGGVLANAARQQRPSGKVANKADGEVFAL